MGSFAQSFNVWVGVRLGEELPVTKRSHGVCRVAKNGVGIGGPGRVLQERRPRPGVEEGAGAGCGERDRGMQHVANAPDLYAERSEGVGVRLRDAAVA